MAGRAARRKVHPRGLDVASVRLIEHPRFEIAFRGAERSEAGVQLASMMVLRFFRLRRMARAVAARRPRASEIRVMNPRG